MFAVKKQTLLAAVLAGAVVQNACHKEAARTEPRSNAFARAIVTRNPQVFNLTPAEAVIAEAAVGRNHSALLKAIREHDPVLTECLLASCADVDASDANGLTPLMWAAHKGDLVLLKRLLRCSAKIDARDANGLAATHHALLAGQAAALEILLPLATNLDWPPAQGRKLLAMACDTGDSRLIEMVLQSAPANLEWTQQTRSALLSAISSGKKELIQLLLSRHPAPPTTEDGKVPLLAQAIATDDARLFEILLAAGTNLNVVLPTPVEKSFVSLLKSEDLRAHVRGDSGITPLMIAAALGKTEYVRVLLAAGADRKLKTVRYKMLALYFAAHTKKTKCVQLLLGRGPDPEELRVEISLARQRASVIKNGVPVLHTPISTGRSGFDTPRGEYVITDKNRDHRSSVYDVEMPFFMRLNCLDFGMHAGVVPNYPASHGCIRLPFAAAERLFREVPVGTFVMIN